MHYQPNIDYKSNDVVNTPLALAKLLVRHFKPKGRILEPCKGTGNFLTALGKAEWCEIEEGRDFFEWKKKVDWIFTNPPWSRMRDFLNHGMAVSDNVMYLVTVNHLWTKARVRDVKAAGFGIKEIALTATPKSFPPSGFQLGAIHLQRGWTGGILISDLMQASADLEPVQKRGKAVSANLRSCILKRAA